VTERREFARFTISVPIRMRFACPFGEAATINARTRNISEEGVTVEIAISEDPQQVTPYVWDKMPVELAIMLPKNYIVQATARLVWHRLGTDKDKYCFEGGLFLTGMTDDDRTLWEQFITHVAVMEPTGRGHGTCASNHDASTR